jgi:N-acyl-D-aspartate/D-glutamate deacylase
MSYDVLIKHGTLVDGTGAPRYRADVALAQGKIAAIGQLHGPARRVIDASGLIVSPGFIDPHTHYDAQLSWDPLLSSSSAHGVTSVVMGNCGVGIAPCRPEAREMAMWDLVNVEGIPFEVLRQGIRWEWTHFPEYMEAVERRGVGINVGFLAPLTPLRHFVMGEQSLERQATAEETARIQALLREALAAGAFGLTTTNVAQHIGYKGRPLSCRNASREELAAYGGVLREAGRGVMQLALTNSPGMLSASEYELLAFLLEASERPVTWLALLNRDDAPDACQHSLLRAEPLLRQGAVPQVTCRPMIIELGLRNPFILGNLPSWQRAFNQPLEAQLQLYREADFRQAFRDDLRTPRVFSGRWERLEVKEVGDPALGHLVGRTVADIARERGRDGLEVFLDVALEDALRTKYTVELFNADETRIPELLLDKRTLLGLSDGGAHVDMLCDAGYCTYLLGTWVREKGVMSLEHAIQRITSEPADFFGLSGRGRLAVGLAADLTLFDANTVGSPKRPEARDDLPGGARRLVAPARGIAYTFVNGTLLFEGAAHTGALPGQVLRSGRA